MKKLLVLFTLFVLVSLPVAALAPTKQSVTLTQDKESSLICATVSVTDGDAIVGHFGLSYNPQKLTPVTFDGKALPMPLPDKTDDGKSSLLSVVRPSSSDIVITPENNKPSTLVNTEKGYLLFGWYATKEIHAVTPSLNGGKIAELFFELADGLTQSDLTEADMTAINMSDVADISGWSNGMIVINSENSVYSTQETDNTLSLITEFRFFPEDMEKEPIPDNNLSEEQQPSENDPVTGDQEDPEPVAPPVNNPDTFVENGNSEEVSFALHATAFSEKIRLFWQKPANVQIHAYQLLIKDSEENLIREYDGIVGASRSLTVDGLAPEFDFTVTIEALDTSGTKLIQKVPLSVSTSARLAESVPVQFSVTYNAGIGSLYGLDNETVLFGEKLSKIPQITAPDGYIFAGWSTDGKNVIDLSKSRMYKDAEFFAVYKKA